MKKKFILFILAMFPVVLLGGGEIVIKNLTPEQMPQNPSETYSINVEVSSMSSDVNKDRIKPSVVINGEVHPMTKEGVDANSFTYDFKMPAGANTTRYYFLVEYATKVFGVEKVRPMQSKLYDLHLINRYPSSMGISRGPVGAIIPLAGRGLSEGDTIVFGDTEVETHYMGHNALSFRVPTLRTGKVYNVSLNGNKGLIPMGEFRIDPASIRVNHEKVALKPHEHTIIVFEIDNPAPKGGIALDITTNIPQSVIMPEIIIPAGSKSATAAIEGGMPGTGYLYIEADGFDGKTIPVTVREDKTIVRSS